MLFVGCRFLCGDSTVSYDVSNGKDVGVLIMTIVFDVSFGESISCCCCCLDIV